MLRWIGMPSKENCSVGSASVRVIELEKYPEMTFPRTPAGHPLDRNQEGINSADAEARGLENSLTWLQLYEITNPKTNPKRRWQIWTKLKNNPPDPPDKTQKANLKAPPQNSNSSLN
jgi:hypothetical protein